MRRRRKRRRREERGRGGRGRRGRKRERRERGFLNTKKIKKWVCVWERGLERREEK